MRRRNTRRPTTPAAPASTRAPRTRWSARRPGWLRDLGVTSWLLVGVTLLLVGAVWLLALTQTIVMPVIAAGVVAAVASPVVGVARAATAFRARRRAALLLLALVARRRVGSSWSIVGGISSESDSLSEHISSAETTIQGWLQDLGDRPEERRVSATSDAAQLGELDGPGAAARRHRRASRRCRRSAFFLALTALSLFFLLKDGPTIRALGRAPHGRARSEVAQTISGPVLQSLRGYFFGVTIVAVFNAVVVGVGALHARRPAGGDDRAWSRSSAPTSPTSARGPPAPSRC